ncbi:BTB/POZ domain-containing protein At2g13690-like [Typha angustifolia]|uniref:BTB/POZ domain-containing protein At2g13690-like n=1 Tax=Typha angustifolia TaxID=59011 RepID=UPI003C2F7F25
MPVSSSANTGGRRLGRRPPAVRPPWCCSTGVEPQIAVRRFKQNQSPQPPEKLLSSSAAPSRRMLSPGRVSPIDYATVESESRLSSVEETRDGASLREKVADLRVRLKGNDGSCLVLEMDWDVLCENSSVFAGMVDVVDCREIEVVGLEDFDAFKDAIELMCEKDEMRWLMAAGVARAIKILEVCFLIMFDRGVTACLKYIEAVPWNESEEEKLKSLFVRCNFDETVSKDVLARLDPQGLTFSSDLTIELIRSVTNGTKANARKQLQSLVYSILSRSSVYQKDIAGLNKESIYDICHFSLNCLVEFFEEASDPVPADQTAAFEGKVPLVERISQQVENLNWMLEVLIDQQMAEDFVHMWADQKELVRMHERASPMVRYELSRITAAVFTSMGRGRLHCRGDKRFNIFQAWFRPMLMDFSWLRICSKGLDIRMLEESLGQSLLTLTLKQQESLFMEWFQFFSKKGKECPNLSKAFQVWWRRSFVRTVGQN